MTFQSTHSLRSATQKSTYRKPKARVSIHALLAECDDCLREKGLKAFSFNPRTPCGVRLQHFHPIAGRMRFQSTHSLRSATPRNLNSINGLEVSIHALLAECDARTAGVPSWYSRFNPRTPCGVRLRFPIPLPLLPMFQSTHSLRSATYQKWVLKNPHSVSIHALLAECDKVLELTHVDVNGFQSTHSLRSAT